MTRDPSDGPMTAPRLRVASLRGSGSRPFRLEPGPAARARHAAELGALSLKKLRFEGELSPLGKAGWRLDAQLGATVVQACIVTLEPVTTRIDLPVVRDFLPPERLDRPEPGSETEVPEEDEAEELGAEIDLEAVMLEALSLALPAYPRKDGVELGEMEAAPAGAAPIDEEGTKPFAGLAALREKMQDKGEED